MKIKITSCHLQILWYNNQIGQVFTPYREYPESYLVRATDGYSNIVYKCDCEQIHPLDELRIGEIILKEKDK